VAAPRAGETVLRAALSKARGNCTDPAPSKAGGSVGCVDVAPTCRCNRHDGAPVVLPVGGDGTAHVEPSQRRCAHVAVVARIIECCCRFVPNGSPIGVCIVVVDGRSRREQRAGSVHETL